jgi:mono/diheme cytochrome c family protein
MSANRNRVSASFLMLLVATGWITAGASLLAAGPTGPAPAPTKAQIEADWWRQEEVRSIPALHTGKQTSPEEDAVGALDGIKDGKWGFHTELENDPWWQADLGASTAIDRVLLFNRCDHTAGRIARLTLLLSDDGKQFRQVYRHNGSAFYGHPDGKPLKVLLDGTMARFVRIQLPGKNCLHLDEVEIYARGDARNIALGKPATQSSVCDWSTRKAKTAEPRDALARVLRRGAILARGLKSLGAKIDAEEAALQRIAAAASALGTGADENARRQLCLEAHWAVRRMALANPLLDFKDIVFVMGAPGKWSHMSDQYLGWWSQPGGGLYVLENSKTNHSRVRCLTPGFAPGNVIRPDISYDGRKVLFAYCRHYPGLSEWNDKLDKSRLPEDSFYHLFEINVDGTGLRQLTRGKYNDFDGRYLPDGRIVFCSTRRGQAIQCNKQTAMASLSHTALPESYVRCGGGPERPCAVYTLHTMDADGKELRPISAFEMFEWTPSVDHQGRILYSRWDYIDRYGQNAMGIWATMPDGTGSQAIFGNFTRNPECFFEARAIPSSRKLVLTASGHHSITAGSLVLLDPSLGADVPAALTRLTPEVPFPESEGQPATYFANPYPLSEQFFLTAWSDRPLKFQGSTNDTAAMGLYLYDASGNLELIYRDPTIGSQYPLPVRPRPRPQQVSPDPNLDGPQEARMLLLNVYEGLDSVPRGSIKRLRVVGMPVKTHPTMDYPSIGLTSHDSGRFVLGTVPVENDGSALFRIPSGVTVFFQALDADGMAVQTMRSGTYLQAGQTATCIGCHEQRTTAPGNAAPLAAQREPSRLAPGPRGSWPLDYSALVQPVLDRQCVSCHRQGGKGPKFDLTPAKSYDAMVSYGSPSLKEIVVTRWKQQISIAGQCEARVNPLFKLLQAGHYEVKLTPDDRDALITWMDTLGQRSGHFSPQQEQELRRLRETMATMLGSR